MKAGEKAKEPPTHNPHTEHMRLPRPLQHAPLTLAIRVLSLPAALLLLCAGLHAEGVISYSTRDGLSSRRVYAVIQDSDSFLWFSTGNGIDRYDYNEFRHYELPFVTSLMDLSQIGTRLLLDSSHSLWVVLQDGRLYRYLSHLDSFKLVCDLSEAVDAYEVTCACFTPDGDLLFGTGSGLYLRDMQNGVTATEPLLPGHRLTEILPDGKGGYYAGDMSGLYYLPSEGGAAEDVRGAEGLRISSLASDGERLFAGTFSSGLWYLDLSEGNECGTTAPLRRSDEATSYVPVNTIVPDGTSGDILVGYDGEGVTRLSRDLKLKERYTAGDSNLSICDNTVISLLVDFEGRVWVCTSTNGISCLDPYKRATWRWRHENGNPLSIPSDNVNATMQDSRGRIWIGTNQGACVMEASEGEVRTVPSLRGNVILCFEEGPDGSIWIGGYGTPLTVIDPVTLRERSTPGYDFSTHEHVYALHREGSSMWIGSLEDNLLRYGGDATVTEFPIKYVGDIQSYEERETEGGDVLVACSAGLLRLDGKGSGTKTLPIFGKGESGGPVKAVRRKGGSIYCATDRDGVIVYDILTGASTHLWGTMSKFRESFGDILLDEGGRVWASTEDNLYILDEEGGTLAPASLFYDLAECFFNQTSSCSIGGDRLALGTSSGLVMIDVSPVEQTRRSTPRVLLTAFQLSGTDFKGTQKALSEGSIDSSTSITLPSRSNSFTLFYSSLGNTSAGAFRYTLLGYDSGFTTSMGPGSAPYRNLPSGKYTFRVEYYDTLTGKTISSKDLGIRIKVRPLLSWWAFLVYALLGSAALSVFLYGRRKRVKDKMLRDRIRTFIGFAHDLKTPVTLIKAPLSDLSLREDIPADAKEDILLANRNSDRLLSMLNRLLDLRIPSESESLGGVSLSRCDVNDFIREKTDIFRQKAISKGLALAFEGDGALGTVLTDTEKLSHILENLLSNAIKYTAEGSVTVRTLGDAKGWKLQVSDTGIGLPPSERKKIFEGGYRTEEAKRMDEYGYGIGLMITRQLVRELGGRIEDAPNSERGTVFTVTLPLKYSSKDVGKAIPEDREEALSLPEEGPAVPPAAPSDIPAPGDPAPVPSTPGETGEGEQAPARPSILFVEDDPAMMEYLLGAFGDSFDTLCAVDGTAALEHALAGNPDLVISDIVMPGMNGFELCRTLKSSVETSHIPVILLTAMDDRVSIIQGLESGADDYISKPFDMSVLRVRVRNILSGRELLRESILRKGSAPKEDKEGEPAYPNRLDQEFMDRLVKYLEDNLSDYTISINDVCREVGMSRTTLFKKIKSLTGLGPNDYIRTYRLNRAKELLSLHEHNVSEVSDMVGFSDSKYFSVCFKKQFGISPKNV